MKEIEVKILNINVAQVTQRIGELGAIKVFEGEVTSQYFDFPDRRITLADKVLRLRRKGEITELTLKRKESHKEAKIMREYEVVVSDFEATRKIMGLMGLQAYKIADKHRASYHLGSIHFELDTLPGIPTFLEIEAQTLERLREYVAKLGFSMKDTVPWSWCEVLKFYKVNE